MLLTYVDESGDLGSPDSSTVVLGAVAVREDLMRKVRRQIDSVIASHLDSHLTSLEIHAQHMLAGKGPWRGIPVDVRRGLLEALCALMSDLQFADPIGFSCYAIVRSPGAVAYADPLERCFEELLLRTSIHSRDARCMTMIIADESKHENVIQPRVDAWRDGNGTRFGKLSRVAEVPLFADSRASRFLQMADLVAHACFRAYERNDANLLDLLLPAFRTGDDGKIHGLVHLTSDYPHCDCVACASRSATPPPGSQLVLFSDASPLDSIPPESA